VNEYYFKNKYHGYFRKSMVIGGETYDLQPMLKDLHPGCDWYADPNYNRSYLNSLKQVVEIHGTFRHVHCSDFFCKKCTLIPQFPDFRKRVVRLKGKLFPNGERVCEQGVNLPYLLQSELIESIQV
jgi:hypothetical protein